MSEHVVELCLSNASSRNEVRMRVVKSFFLEEAGTSEDTSRYTYYVETLSDGKRVFLRRPAALHNGFDFVVRVGGVNFAANGKRRRDAPSHDDIVSDLVAKKNENRIEYERLYKLLMDVYECKDVSDAQIQGLEFNIGFPVDLIVKTVKWLFIEQDIRYWNYSGRKMLWSGFPEP